MSSFEANRLVRSAGQILHDTPENIFPLLCPTREYEWIGQWACDMIFSNSGFAEDNCVFATQFPEEDSPDVWVVCRYEPPLVIQFVRVNDCRVIRYSITLEQTAEGTTKAEWRQVITALNEKGNLFIASLTDEAYSELIKNLETLLNHYLTTGTMLRQTD